MSDQLKHCPICTQDLPAGDFGLCRARRDGHNLYCKPCIREKVAASRRTFKEYKSIRKGLLQSKIETQLTMPIRIVDREYPIDKVREAIKSGHNTLRLMVAKTKLPTDQVTDLIADLLLWKREIKSATVGETRIYFFVEEKPAPIVQRKPMVCAGSGFTKKEQPMRRWAVG